MRISRFKCGLKNLFPVAKITAVVESAKKKLKISKKNNVWRMAFRDCHGYSAKTTKPRNDIAQSATPIRRETLPMGCLVADARCWKIELSSRAQPRDLAYD